MTTVINIRTERKTYYAAIKAKIYVYVGRGPFGPGEWGNRYASKSSKVKGVIHVESAAEAVRQHRKEILDDEAKIAKIRVELKDKVLGCWCHPNPCHAQTLADIADGKLG